MNAVSRSGLYGPVHNDSSRASTARGANGPVRLSVAKRAQRTLLRLLCQSAPALGESLAWRHFTTPRTLNKYDPQDLPEGATAFRLPYRAAHLSGYVWGGGDKTVYLVHGWEGHLGHVAGFVLPLLNAGFRVVAFDMPGHGRSPKQRTDLKDFAEALVWVTRRQGQPYGVVAHSFGATATLLAAPEVTPQKLTLIAPMRSLHDHVALFDRVVGLPADVKKRLVRRLEHQIGLPLHSTDTVTTVQPLALGGLVVHDRDDRLIAYGSGQAVAAAWGAPLYTTHGLGHRKILSDPAVIARVLRYLSD